MKILIVRNSADEVNINSYNLQEIGLAKALVKKGHECDIVYYTKSKTERVEIIEVEDKIINVIWMPAIKILNNAIYTKILKTSFIDKYDIIQTSEYTQLMTYLLTYKNKKVVLYHGPYKDLNKKKFHKLYDFLFLRRLTKKIDCIISKSELATNYLKEKGFKNIYTLGVGLDLSRFKDKNNSSIEDLNKIDIENEKVLLYIGKLEERRNIIFLFDVFNNVLNKNQNVRLLLIGNGEKLDVERYFEYADEIGIMNKITYIQSISQDNIRKAYELSDLFLFPSKYEIFGMVIMESMYFKKTIISSVNGGSSTIIKNNMNGILMEKFDVEEWSNIIIELLENDNLTKEISRKAYDTIVNDYDWECLADKYIKVYQSIK